MIASFTHNFAFIKTRKTAGTSVEIVLSTWCSGADIVTPVIPEDEIARSEFGALPRNFGGDPLLQAAYIDAVRRADRAGIERLHALLRQPLRKHGYFGHMPAARIRERLPEFWEQAFTFTVVRHPYEVVVSRAYWWTRSHDDTRPIGEILQDVIAHPRLSDKYMYTDRDRVIVGRLVRYETLWTELADIARSFGQSLPDPLPRAKGTTRADRRPAREVLSVEQRRRIADRCAFEFELMGFER